MKFAPSIVPLLALALLLPTEASVLDSRKNLRSSNAEEVKEIDARELHDQRTKEVRETHHKRTAPEHHRPRSKGDYPVKNNGPAPKHHHRPRSGEHHPTFRADASFRNFEPFTAEKLAVAIQAAEYSNDVYETLDGIEIHEAHDGVDVMAMHSDKSFCWVIFRGSDHADDYIKNFNIQAYTLEDTDGCKVHEGFYRNYAGMGKYGDDAEKVFEPMITDFLESEECASKQVIFTGHSMGGASALVAAIIWSQLDPIAITFGQPAVLTTEGKGSCQINEDNIWRFINSENRLLSDGISYDLVPAANPNPHIGGFIVLPPVIQMEVSIQIQNQSSIVTRINPGSITMYINMIFLLI